MNTSQDPKVATNLQKLLRLLSDDYGIEYVILDAPSGVRAAYGLALDVSHDVLMMFRWSVQHVEGTLNMIKAIGMMRDYGQKYVPTRVVASAVPQALEIEQLADETLKQALQLTRRQARQRVEEHLDRYQMVSPTVFHEIPEMLEMKWKEGVAVFGTETSPYQQLVEKLLQVHRTA